MGWRGRGDHNGRGHQFVHQHGGRVERDARWMDYASLDRYGMAMAAAVPSIQVVAGIMILWFKALLLQLGGSLL